uniref:Trypsin-co-occurring domain-containing protein n=1 Tax=Oscillatoriales cyanobacterium SpSt-418 TaxID=2282169 RepID=A0A7C3PHM2_9CYAN
MTSPTENGFLDLAESIRGLRSELDRAIDERDWSGSKIRFRLKPIHLKLQVVAKREGGVEGKVRWYLVEASAKGQLASEVTQIIELELEPLEIDAAGQRGNLEVGSSQPSSKKLAD